MLSSYAEQTMVDTMPMAACVFTGPEHIINAVNQPMLTFWAVNQFITGQPFTAVSFLSSNTDFASILNQVYQTGQDFHDPEGRIVKKVSENLPEQYYHSSFKVLRDKEGLIYGVVHTAVDISKLITTRRQVEQLNEDLAVMNQEQAASNEELRTTVEELRATNEHLEEARQTAVTLRRAAEENEMRLHNILNTMAEGLALFDAKGKTYYLNQAAYKMLDIPQNSVRSRSYNDARWINMRRDGSVMPPEEHPMYLALNTQLPVTAHEVMVQLSSGKRIEVLVNAAPLYDLKGNLTGGVATFIDATEHLATSRRLKESEANLQNANEELTTINEEQSAVNEELRVSQEELQMSNYRLSENREDLRLTLEAANLGTFSLDIASGKVTINDRCREMFGFASTGEISTETVFAAINPKYLPQVQGAMDNAIRYGQLCDVQYEIIRQHSHERRWMRSVGRSYRMGNGRAIRFYGVVVDVTGEKELEKRKDDFISIASHELKTPITSLKAALQLMDKLKNQPDSPMMPKLLLQARRSVERVGVLIDDLLNVGRLQQSELQLNKTIFILSQLLSACANPIALAGRHKVSIIGEWELQVYADEHRIDQVVTNFLTNAVKYAPESQFIEMSITKQDNEVKVAIKDNGPGIPPDRLQHLFDRYYRVNEAGHHISGLGLGLYISAEIIQRHGGQIGADSELGKGSTFWFTLPLQDQQAVI